MDGLWQSVRVFISSTFRDMHSEGDWLVRRVFPVLRERLEKYDVHLIDIDLRWIATEQHAASGGAMKVCLKQIDCAAATLASVSASATQFRLRVLLHVCRQRLASATPKTPPFEPTTSRTVLRRVAAFVRLLPSALHATGAI
jgi:hypothetical protein